MHLCVYNYLTGYIYLHICTMELQRVQLQCIQGVDSVTQTQPAVWTLDYMTLGAKKNHGIIFTLRNLSSQFTLASLLLYDLI
jgi:hypothetical protein